MLKVYLLKAIACGEEERFTGRVVRGRKAAPVRRAGPRHLIKICKWGAKIYLKLNGPALWTKRGTLKFLWPDSGARHMTNSRREAPAQECSAALAESGRTNPSPTIFANMKSMKAL